MYGKEILTLPCETGAMQEKMTISPRQIADRLGEIRGLIRGLKAEEARLRNALLNAGLNGPIDGAQFRVQVQERSTKRFDHQKLPDAILQDTRYWKQVTSKAVITRSLSNLKQGTLSNTTTHRAPKPQESAHPPQLIEPW